jgi:hypothetical protein
MYFTISLYAQRNSWKERAPNESLLVFLASDSREVHLPDPALIESGRGYLTFILQQEKLHKHLKGKSIYISL